MKDESRNEIINSVKKELANFLGVEIEDIEDSDSFTEDLHMQPSDLADFIQNLGQNMTNIPSLNISEIETVGELLEEITN